MRASTAGALGLVREQPPSFALFEKGFRPFFLLAALFAVAIVPLWLLHLWGAIELGGYFVATSWHAHEMVFGFTVAVIAGFLLTAASNWTQRETARGVALGLLTGLWIAGRIAMSLSHVLPGVIVAVTTLAFVPALGFTVGRVIIATRNFRNAGFLVVLAALFTAQLSMHVGALGGAPALERTGALLGVDLVALLILLVGGRVIPMFTRAATSADVRSSVWLDRAAILAMASLTFFDAVGAPASFIAGTSGAVALAAVARATRWGSLHTRREPLLWVLHLGYAFVPIGLALRAASFVTPLATPSLATHALTVGAIGLLTLGMMVRVTLGHTGRPLRAGRTLGLAFGLVTAAAVARVAGALLPPASYLYTLVAAGSLWSVAFALFVTRLAGVLVRPRTDGRRG